MRARLIRGTAMLLASYFFAGISGIELALIAAVLHEIVGLRASGLWCISVGALGAAAVADVVQRPAAAPVISAHFIEHQLASMFVRVTLIFALYAAVIDLRERKEFST